MIDSTMENHMRQHNTNVMAFSFKHTKKISTHTHTPTIISEGCAIKYARIQMKHPQNHKTILLSLERLVDLYCLEVNGNGKFRTSILSCFAIPPPQCGIHCAILGVNQNVLLELR